MKKNQKGFTLIELLLYLVIVSVFITGAIFYAWDIIYGREKAFQQQLVEQNCRSVLARIAYEIRRADEIKAISANSIEFENGDNDTLISLSSGVVQIASEGLPAYNLTSNQVYTTDLTFTELSPDDENTKNINVVLTLRQAETNALPQFQAQTTMSQSIELKSQFNQGRSLLMDASGAYLINEDRRLEGATLQNSAPTDITIDKITLFWTANTDILDIIINGLTVWSGTALSGTELDITDTTLISSNSPISIDRFRFSNNMNNSTITVLYTMADNSTASTELVFGAPASPSPSPSPSPSVSPSPSPSSSPSSSPSPLNCNQYCQGKYGLPGSCIKQNDCGGYDENRIYECSSPNICCCQ